MTSPPSRTSQEKTKNPHDARYGVCLTGRERRGKLKASRQATSRAFASWGGIRTRWP
jgi:hypothetical protein